LINCVPLCRFHTVISTPAATQAADGAVDVGGGHSPPLALVNVKTAHNIVHNL
jgi:hypothetical protein